MDQYQAVVLLFVLLACDIYPSQGLLLSQRLYHSKWHLSRIEKRDESLGCSIQEGLEYEHAFQGLDFLQANISQNSCLCLLFEVEPPYRKESLFHLK